MEELLTVINKLGGASFASLLAIILWASWKDIWTWSREVAKLVARYEALLLKEQQEKEWWREVAIRATGIAGAATATAAAVAKKES